MKIIIVGSNVLAFLVLLSYAVIPTTAAAAAAAEVEGSSSSTFVTTNVEATPIEYVDTYDNDEPLLGYISIPQSVLDDDEKKVPAVVILPTWNNIDDYVKIRATMLAYEFEWISLTADIYGKDFHNVNDTDYQTQIELSSKYKNNPELYNGRIQAAIDTMATHPNVDPTKIALIGYCFGGTGVLSYSFADTLDDDTTNNNATTTTTTTTNRSTIVGGVSFHGGLTDFEVEGSMAHPLLIVSGGDDDTGTAVEELESKLVEANATWQISRYSGLTHGFTVFDSPAYNEWVDKRSWNEMGTFLQEVFQEINEYGTTPPIEGIDYYVTNSDSVVPMGGEEVNASFAESAEQMMDMDTKDSENIDTDPDPDTDTDDTIVAVETIMYDDNGFPLTGYLTMPVTMMGEDSSNSSSVDSDDDNDDNDNGKQLYPAVVIVPNWDGVNGPNGYEAQRAVMMSMSSSTNTNNKQQTNNDDNDDDNEEEGSERNKKQLYIGMVADIYGVEYTTVDEYEKKMELSNTYRSDPTVFVSRIQAAIQVLLDHPSVDNNYIFVAGYCFGGSGAMDYAFANPTTTFAGVKAVVPIHGGLNPLRGTIQTNDNVTPYVLVLSGGVDDQHGNTTELEMHLDSANATWEITRYSNAQHGFTEWGADAYQKMADSRSWWSMMSLFDSIIAATSTTNNTTDNTGIADEYYPTIVSGSGVVYETFIVRFDTTIKVPTSDADADGGNDDTNDDSASSSFGISMIVVAIASVVTIVGLL